jgi:hypothetical protein
MFQTIKSEIELMKRPFTQFTSPTSKTLTKNNVLLLKKVAWQNINSKMLNSPDHFSKKTNNFIELTGLRSPANFD